MQAALGLYGGAEMSLAAQSVIGSILIEPACLTAVRPLAAAQDFPLAADRAIFEAACRLADTRKPADVLTIIDDARRHGSDVSDQYAAELLQVTPTAAHAAEYARQVHEEAVRRRLTAVGETLLEDAQDQQKPTAGVIAATMQTVLYGIIGALIGAAIGGVFGGIVGGIVGISLGLAIHWGSITYDEVPKRTVGGFSGSGGFGSRTSRAAYQSLQVPPVSTVNLPRLATGAVIPPNREFLAVLGDQRQGTNIEAPAEMIRQMVADGIRAAGIGSGNRSQTVILQVGRRELGRVVYELNKEETQRVGVRLAGVKA